MRAGWEMTTIGEACRVVNGGTPKTKIPEYWGGRHQWITPAEMGGREDRTFLRLSEHSRKKVFRIARRG